MAAPKVTREHWMLRERTISKRCSYYGLGGRWSAQTGYIEIEFNLSRITRLLEPQFRIVVRPSPLSDWEDGHLDARIVFPNLESEPSPLMLVMIENAADRSLIITSTQAKDAEGLVDNLCFGKDLELILQDGDERLLELPIPNDHGVYDLIRKAML